MDILFVPIIIFVFNFIGYSLPMISTYISLDAFFISGGFFLSCIKGKSSTEIVKNQDIYVLSTVNRYIWYILCSIVYQILVVMFWVQQPIIINIIFYSINIPYVQNKLVQSVFNELFEEINNRKKNFVKRNFVKQFTKITNVIIKTYANRKDNIVSKKDINYLLKNYDETMNYAKMIMQNIAVLYLLHFLRSYGSKFQFVVKKVYNYYYNDKKITNTNIIDLKIILNDICDNKDWKKLLNPAFVKLMLNIYYNANLDPENNILLIVKNQLFYSMAKFSAIWTVKSVVVPYMLKLDMSYIKNYISIIYEDVYHDMCEKNILINIFDNIIVLLYYVQSLYVPIIYLSFHVYKYGLKPIYSIDYIGKLLGIAIGVILYNKLGSDFVICFVSEFFYYVFLNSLSIGLYRAIYIGIVNFVINNRKLSQYQINTIILSAISCMSMYWVIPQSENYLYEKLILFTSALSISVGYCSIKNIWNIIPFIIVLNISAQSCFNPIHIMLCIPNIFVLMNYLNSEMFLNLIFKISYVCDYKLDDIIKSISSYIPDYELLDDIKLDESVIINNDHNPILIESFFS